MNITNWPLIECNPFSLYPGNIRCRALRNAYIFEMEPPVTRMNKIIQFLESLIYFSNLTIVLISVPGASMESPVSHPIISRILAKTTLSIKINTGAISYVNMLVFAVAVSHSPAIETKSNPVDS